MEDQEIGKAAPLLCMSAAGSVRNGLGVCILLSSAPSLSSPSSSLCINLFNKKWRILTFFLACVSQLNQQIVRRNDKPVPFDGSQQLELLSPLSAISASFWAYSIEAQNNVRGKKSVMTWEGTLPGTEVTEQQPL